jgi:dolichol-phosphate mannosyltransferase
MKLSVVIPAYNEEESIAATLEAIVGALERRGVDHEVFVVNDNSRDGTEELLAALSRRMPTLRYATNTGPNGFGYAVRYGLERFSGDCIAVMMADLSDSPDDLIRFYDTLVDGGYDCVFGSRFIRGGTVVDYPLPKRVINRIANLIIRLSMNIDYNDTTNAFKMYRRSTIEGLKPFLSPHFNLTIELPLKAIIRGYSYVVLPNAWHNRKYGVSKLAIREMGTRYFFILCYCLIEKYFSKGDFRKKW